MNRLFNLSSPPIILGLAVCGLMFQSCQGPQGASSPDLSDLPTGQEIVNRAREMAGCRTARLKIKAHVTEENGVETTWTILTYQKCVGAIQYSLRQVVSSKEEPSLVLLSIERPGRRPENVTYLPGFQRFVEVEDLSREDPVFGLSIQESLGAYDLYRYRLVGTERIGPYESYKVEGRLKPSADSQFTRTVMYYRQDNYLPLRLELYNSKNHLVRLTNYSEWAQVRNHWTAMRTNVDNRRYKKRIVFETVEADYDSDLPVSFFSRENLKRLVLNH